MRKTILIVDDDEMYQEILGKLFRDKYHVVYAENGKEAIHEMGVHMDNLAMMLLDLQMPVLSGYQVLQLLNAKGITHKIPILLITGEEDEEMRAECYKNGCMEIINKPFNPKVVYERVTELISLFENVGRLEGLLKTREEELEEQQRKMKEFNETLIEAVSNIVEFRNLESGQHVKRVKGLTKIIALTYQKLFPDEGITPHDIEVIVQAAAIHDIGKICIPDSILLKPGKLDNDERQVMKSHTTKGCELLQHLKSVQDQELYRVSYEICRSHHERDDGNGYPDNLKGDEIPISARLVSIVDVYDALVSDRIYKKAYGKEKAYDMIINGECGQFHPRLLEAFTQARELLEEFSDRNQ